MPPLLLKTKHRKPRETILRAVRANAGVEAAYRERLTGLVDEMKASVMHWLRAALNANPSRVAELAEDASPVEAIRRALRKLQVRWTQRIDEAAPRLADWFATAAHKRNDATLRKILRDSGIAIEWTLTPAMRDILQATIAEQVSLIKSIPAQLFTQVEGIVMRGMTVGRDVGHIAKEVERRFAVTRKRAQLIARDQSNKASSTLQRGRQLALAGPDAEAIWCHSNGGKVPRPTHVKAGRDKVRYKVAEGWPDPALGGKRIWPGTEVNCRCFARLVIPGLTQ